MSLPDQAFPIVIDNMKPEELLDAGDDAKLGSDDEDGCLEGMNDTPKPVVTDAKDPGLSEEKMVFDNTGKGACPTDITSIQLQAEDYGGSIALPHYGFKKPSADYFNSNLMSYNFVMADITNGKNHVFFYDERHQGKGADALCSLRMRYHLNKTCVNRALGVKKSLSMSLLDNCVGQNKSQIVMKFFCMLSLLFYDTVALLFFLPGHSHMIADRVVAYCKYAIKGLNLYTLSQIVDESNRIRNVNAEWLRPNDWDRPFRIEWATVLNKYFKNLPSGYTANYFFEFSGGCVTYRKLGTTPSDEATTVRLDKPVAGLRKKLLLDLFGTSCLEKLLMADLTLPVAPGRALTKAKLISLSKKYFSIPDVFLKHYPKVPNSIKKQAVITDSKKKSKRQAEPGSADSVLKKRRVGRPKKEVEIGTGFQSITRFFRVNDKNL